MCIPAYSGIPLNKHPQIVDTHNKTNDFESPTVNSFTSILKQLLNSGHPATLFNRQGLRPKCTQTIFTTPI